MDSIAVIRLDNGPVNTLAIGNGTVARLQQAVDAALADPAVETLIITGEGKMFSAGADIQDFDGDLSAITAMRDLLNSIEGSSKPVVMAIHGMALGGGLELTMSGHYRVAHKDAKLGLPEITLGILPGAGGTQRLPRLIPGAAALDLMLTGAPIKAAKAHELGLVDEVTDGDVVAAARAFIAAKGPLTPRPTRGLPVAPDTPDAITAAEARVKGPGKQALGDIVRCVETAVSLDFDSGLAREAALFAELMSSEYSLGLRHAFLGQRQVAVLPDLSKDVRPRAVAKVAVIGAGTMGGGIAAALLAAGIPTTLIDASREAVERARGRIEKIVERDVEKGRLNGSAAKARLDLLTISEDIAAMAQADLIIEAVFEDLDVKREVIGKLDALAKEGAIIASNTSALDVDQLATFTARPQDFVGLHFFSPANIMRLVEVVRGAKTADDVLATAMALVKQLNKVGVVARNCDGFIGNRAFEEYLRQSYFLLEDGAMPRHVDGALEAWGMAMGPLATMDLAGQDIGWQIRKRRAIEQPGRPYSPIPDRVCELGRFGQKTGKGFYLYEDGRTRTVDPLVEAMVMARSFESGIERRAISDEEIVSRCILALVNEGAKIVEEGIAYRPVDVDVVYLNGYGFPAWRGGPMFYADRLGLPKVLETINTYAAGRNGWAWTPSPLIEKLVAEGKDFGSLNR